MEKTLRLERTSKAGAKIRRTLPLYGMFLPVVILLIMFNYGPIYGIVIAFKDFSPFKGVFGSPWVGLKYFTKFLTDPTFWRVMKNTIILNFYDLVFGFTAPIIFALLINEILNTLFKRISQTISYLPHFISYVVVALLFYQVLSPVHGVVNILLMKIGIKPINFLAKSALFRPVVVIAQIWKATGWGAILYFATIAGIDSQLYDAAHIDGAGRMRQVFAVTLPSILPIIVLLLIFRLSRVFIIGFDRIFNFMNPLVMDVADVIATYVYRIGLMNAQYSYTTAIGLVQSLLGFIMLFAANKVSSKVAGLGLW